MKVPNVAHSLRVATGLSSYGISDKRLRGHVAGKVVLLTGASSGVGYATALRLARNGATVIAVARRSELLEQLRDEAVALGADGVIRPMPTDLNDFTAVEELVDQVLADYGRVDVLVNNAGKSVRRWLTDSVDRFDNFEKTANVNYLGPVRLIMSLLPSMRTRHEGHIVNVLTAGVHAPAVGWTAYIASKSALNAWMRGAGAELRAEGISSSAVYLQLIYTPMLGPFWYYKYARPLGNSAQEAASAVCRAIVDRPLHIRPWPERVGAPLMYALDNSRTVEYAKTWAVKVANPSSRPTDIAPIIEKGEDLGRLLDSALGGLANIVSTKPLNVLPPSRLPQTGAALTKGIGLATLPAMFAARFPQRAAIIDDDGEITADELYRRVERAASALRGQLGASRHNRVGILCTNHRGFVIALFAAARLSAHLVPLNYGFSGPQIGSVLEREGVDLLFYDEEFHGHVETSGYTGTRVVVRCDGSSDGGIEGASTLDELVERGGRRILTPAYGGSLVIMTGGTSGVPKGAPRQLGMKEIVPMIKTLHPRMLLAALDLDRIRPLPTLGRPIIATTPLHHGIGLGTTLFGMALGATVIMHRKFDAEQVLADIERHGAGIVSMVPTMLKRIMDLPADVRSDYNTDTLQFVPCGGAPMPPWLGQVFMDEFGEVLFNGYASTESALGTLATPADLRKSPGTVGKPPTGLVQIRIVDDEGRECLPGVSGRIVNKNPMNFRGYSDGNSKQYFDGYMDTGDVGHLDEDGLLYIDGRSDDMILSGGENVFPQEVEDQLLRHDAVADAGCVGVPDDDFGQRLAAFVVLHRGVSLTAEGVRAYVKTHLANYKVPRDVHFVEALPRTTVGKLRRQQLTELIATQPAQPLKGPRTAKPKKAATVATETSTAATNAADAAATEQQETA